VAVKTFYAGDLWITIGQLTSDGELVLHLTVYRGLSTMAFMITKCICAKLVSEQRTYEIPLDVQLRELSDECVVERFRLSPACALDLEDGAYILVYSFNDKQQQIPVCVIDGMLLAGVPA
jgi:hypothetical protein